MPAVLCLARHGERLDYVSQKRGDQPSWFSTAERSWDPPLTERGVQQGASLGSALKHHLERLGLPAASRVISSPLLRCLQTSAAAATELGVETIAVEPGLCEGMTEDWFRSWAIPGADSTWGGPPHARSGTPVSREELHPGAFSPASHLLLDAAGAEAAIPGLQIDRQYSPVGTSPAQSWDAMESEQQLGDRLEATARQLAARYPNETILACSQ